MYPYYIAYWPLFLLLDKINEIEYRSPRDIRAQIYEMLYFWRQGELGPASLERLCQVLTDEGRLAAAGTHQVIMTSLVVLRRCCRKELGLKFSQAY